MKNVNLLIVGGGTGGHISPGIAIYEEARELGMQAYLLVGKADLKFISLKDVSENDVLTYAAPTLTRNIIKLPLFAAKFLFSILRVRKIIRQREIDVVIGMGGYVSGPALIAAQMKEVPVYLCEQNTVPGMVTRKFSKRAEAIFATFSSTEDFLKDAAPVITVGNPIRKKVFTNIGREQARTRFNLTHCQKVMLVIGGSQGAVKINELIVGLKKNYPEQFENIGLIWSVGSHSYDTYCQKIQNEGVGGSVFMSPYIDDVGLAYRATDIAISRSGSGVMMELAAMGIPSILIPYPHAAKDHQNLNADEFVVAGASLKFSDNDAVPEKIGPLLFELLENRTQLKRMGDKATAVSKVDAAAKILEHICAEIRKERPVAVPVKK